MENILMQNALEYARRGWYVFPCRERDSEPFWDSKKGKERVMIAKSPYIAGGFEAATRDENQIKDWWETYPEAAIGIACGASELIVLDIDIKEGRKGYDNWMNLNVSDAGALHSITPSRGMHIVYSGKTNSRANIKVGLDLRSDGAYIVAPPSYIYVCGEKRAYKSVDDWNRIPVEVPSDLVSRLDLLTRGEREKRESAKQYPVDDLAVTIRKAKAALKKLPPHYCDDYFLWVDVGLALKSLGEAGFTLWNDWSKGSSKYDYDACADRWDGFKPREITIASLFYWSKNAK
jgi:hypothetical protein